MFISTDNITLNRHGSSEETMSTDTLDLDTKSCTQGLVVK